MLNKVYILKKFFFLLFGTLETHNKFKNFPRVCSTLNIPPFTLCKRVNRLSKYANKYKNSKETRPYYLLIS